MRNIYLYLLLIVISAIDVNANSDSETARPVYVGNIPHTTTKDQLAKFMRGAGAVKDVRIAYDKSTGESKGFAIVTFEKDEFARKAVEELDGAEFRNRPLRVTFAAQK